MFKSTRIFEKCWCIPKSLLGLLCICEWNVYPIIFWKVLIASMIFIPYVTILILFRFGLQKELKFNVKRYGIFLWACVCRENSNFKSRLWLKGYLIQAPVNFSFIFVHSLSYFSTGKIRKLNVWYPHALTEWKREKWMR